MALLSTQKLSVSFHQNDNTVQLVEDVELEINRGETLGLVGESGSGKSLTSLAIMRLLNKRAGFTIEGSIDFDGENIAQFSDKKMRGFRGKRIAMIFQDPLTSLNPVQKIERQLVWPMRHHLGLTVAETLKRAIELLDRVGIPRPETRLSDYPHQFSGGMRQRLMIAIAISCEPDLLIADEPTTALDVTMQAQIVDLLQELQHDFGMGMIFISHDLSLVASFADKIMVMYAGRIVESGPAQEVISAARMPYTRRLLAAIPRADAPPRKLDAIPGALPDPNERGTLGCLFAPRCAEASARCLNERPELDEVEPKHAVACFFPHNHSKGGPA